MAAFLSTNTGVALVNATISLTPTITLPLTTLNENRQIIFKDSYGNLSNRPLTLQTQGGDTFEDGTTAKILNNSQGVITVYAYNSKWYILGGTQQVQATISSLTVSSINSGSPGGLTTGNLVSSIQGLGTTGYVSTVSLVSTAGELLRQLNTSGLVSSLSLLSTITGLGSSGYVSTLSLLSTTGNLQRQFNTAGFLSTPNVLSTVAGLNSFLFVSTGNVQTSSIRVGILTNSANALDVNGTTNTTTLQAVNNTAFFVSSQVGGYGLQSMNGGNARGFAFGAFNGYRPDGVGDGWNFAYNFYNDNSALTTGDRFPNAVGCNSLLRLGYGRFFFGTGAANTAPTMRMNIDVNGNVGIGYGATAGSFMLDVNGATQLSTLVFPAVAGRKIVYFAATASNFAGQYSGVEIQSQEVRNVTEAVTNSFTFGANPGNVFAEWVRMSNGRVGIGCNAPTQMLDVNGTIEGLTISSFSGFFSTITVNCNAPGTFAGVMHRLDVNGFTNTLSQVIRNTGYFVDYASHPFSNNYFYMQNFASTLQVGMSNFGAALFVNYTGGTSGGSGQLGIGLNPATTLDVAGTGRALRLSTFLVQTSSITATTGVISSLNINSLTVGTGTGFVNIGPLQTVAISSIQANSGTSFNINANASSIQTSSLSFGATGGWITGGAIQAVIFSSIQYNSALGYISSLYCGSTTTILPGFVAHMNGPTKIRTAIFGQTSTLATFFTQPAWDLQMIRATNAAQPAATTWVIGSDIRIKENITEANLERCYEDIKKVKVRRFAWNQEYLDSIEGNDKHMLGFIAQEISSINPKAVGVKEAYGFSNFHFLNIDQLNYSLYGAVKKTMEDKEVLESTVKGQRFTIETLLGQTTTILSTLEGLQGR